MELRANNLVLFEYTGQIISSYLKNVPRPVEAFLNFTGESRLDGGTFALTRFASDVPQLETLNLIAVLSMKILKLPETAPYRIHSLHMSTLPAFMSPLLTGHELAHNTSCAYGLRCIGNSGGYPGIIRRNNPPKGMTQPG
ncbi:hypothetical protein U1Q18_018907 [Sarracenia purpurea var. burkii]